MSLRSAELRWWHLSPRGPCETFLEAHGPGWACMCSELLGCCAHGGAGCRAEGRLFKQNGGSASAGRVLLSCWEPLEPWAFTEELSSEYVSRSLCEMECTKMFVLKTKPAQEACRLSWNGHRVTWSRASVFPLCEMEILVPALPPAPTELRSGSGEL